jgi:hypothetical protein
MMWAASSWGTRALVDAEDRDAARRAFWRWADRLGLTVWAPLLVPASSLSAEQLEGLEVVS